MKVKFKPVLVLGFGFFPNENYYLKRDSLQREKTFTIVLPFVLITINF